MVQSKHVPMTLSVPKECRDKLRTIAARKNLENPDQVTSASTIATEILRRHVEKFNTGECIIPREAALKSESEADEIE